MPRLAASNGPRGERGLWRVFAVDFRLGDGGYAGTDRKVSVDLPWIGNRPREADGRGPEGIRGHGYVGVSQRQQELQCAVLVASWITGWTSPRAVRELTISLKVANSGERRLEWDAAGMRMDVGIGICSPGLGLLVTFAVCLCRSDSVCMGANVCKCVHVRSDSRCTADHQPARARQSKTKASQASQAQSAKQTTQWSAS